MIQSHNWSELGKHAPKELKRLIELCHEFERFERYLNRVSPTVTGTDVGKVQELTFRILAEYVKIINTHIKDKDTIKEIKNEIHNTLSRFFDDKGKLKDLTNEILTYRQRGQLSFYLPLLIWQFKTFINSKIYDSLVEAYQNSLNSYVNFFINSTTQKRGVLPEYTQRKGLEIVKKGEEEE